VRKPYKPVATVYAARDTVNQPRTMTMEDVETFACHNGLAVRPAVRQDRYHYPEGRRQDSYQRQEGPRPPTEGQRRPPGNNNNVLCWHCGKYGHYSRECGGQDRSYRFAPPRNKRAPRDFRINHMDTDECDTQSTHSSETPQVELKA